MILLLALFSLLISSSGYRIPNRSFSSECAGYMFVGEDSTPTCHQFSFFWRAVRALVRSYLFDGNGYGLRGFNNINSFLDLEMMNRDDFLNKIDKWVSSYGDDYCDTRTELIAYSV